MAAKAKRGRPSKYSDALVNKICTQIADGKSLRSICEPSSMPTKETVFNWLDRHPEFLSQYARAREIQADGLFDEAQEIADTATVENVQVAKLKVDVRKWRAGKLRPKVYGEKIQNELSGPDGGAIPVAKVETLTDEQLASIAATGSKGTDKKAKG